jgi:hypothetical protein
MDFVRQYMIGKMTGKIHNAIVGQGAGNENAHFISPSL